MCNNGLAYTLSALEKKYNFMNELKEKIISEIKKIYDPEIPVNIYELGLIYKIEVNKDKKVIVEMTYFSKLSSCRKFA